LVIAVIVHVKQALRISFGACCIMCSWHLAVQYFAACIISDSLFLKSFFMLLATSEKQILNSSTVLLLFCQAWNFFFNFWV